ncbi:MAG: 50S ribosomal protein L4 [Synergistaceae bacterium]|jgi:large subunit ribosomal protein L4|nr:50S ribosomal protein L4 [Synergistaceae bacterium]
MPSVKEFNFKGEFVGNFEVSEEIFDAPVHVPAMHQAVVAHLANMRAGTHNTKDRGDVRGGGRKPWRQKHTGRARAGSNSSPIWVGGGVAHGPHPRDYHQKVNRKVRRIALKSALTLKVRENDMIVVDNLKLDAPKTREVVNFLQSADVGQKPLFLLHESNMAVSKSAGNIPGALVLRIDSINVYDILNHVKLIATPEAVRKLEEVFGA